MSDAHIQPGLPDPRPPVCEERAPDAVICPRCLRSTDSLKVYDLQIILGLIVFWAWHSERVIACPTCMRSALLRRAIIYIPLANLLYPLLLLTDLGHWVGTGTVGHTDPAIADAHRLSEEEVQQRRLSAITRGGVSRKQIVVLLSVVLFIVAIWGGAYIFSRNSEPVVDGGTLTQWTAKAGSPDPQERLRAVQALGKIGRSNKKAIPVLQNAAQHDADVRVRSAAFRTLRDIDPQSVLHINPPDAPFLLPQPVNNWGGN